MDPSKSKKETKAQTLNELGPKWIHLDSIKRTKSQNLPDLGFQNDPKIAPNIDQKSSCYKMASKTAPRPPKILPRRSQDSPGPPQDRPRPSPTASQESPGPLLDRPKIENFEIVENMSKKKVDHGRLRWSLNTIARKNRKSVHNSRTPEGGGGGRAKRSSIRRPQRSTACGGSP